MKNKKYRIISLNIRHCNTGARLAQSVEHQTFNLRVKGSSPLLGAPYFCVCTTDQVRSLN